MITKYTIYGERCSGTNYLQSLIRMNYEVDITWEYGWKHFFGFKEEALKDSDDTLFICIVRDIVPWMNSLFRDKWHIAPHLRNNIHNFLNAEFFSYNDESSGARDGKEMLDDRNIYTGKRYKNIFELRHTKIKYLIEDLPKKVKHYIFIKYEDLVENFEETMKRIRNKGLRIKPNINYPLNTNQYKGYGSRKMHTQSKKKYISEERIYKHPHFNTHYEDMLGYIK